MVVAMSTSFSLYTYSHAKVRHPSTTPPWKFNTSKDFKRLYGRKLGSRLQARRCSMCCLGNIGSSCIDLTSTNETISDHFGTLSSLKVEFLDIPRFSRDMIRRLLIADLDPATAKLAIGILGPFLSAFAFLFILRIVMSWYPKLPVGKFPYVIAYAPTEPLLIPTRKLIPPLGGVDITPVVWFGLVSFLNEILVGPQGLLVLLSQQVGS